MQIHADHGDIFISLPRCFRGSITIATDHGPITFSPSLAACTATFLDTIDERAYFVGDRPRKGKSRSGNKGDKAQSTEKLWDILEVRGVRSKVRINWVDEQEQPKIRPGGGKALWNSLRRLFKSG
ncbi:hypothetical protein BJV74DRAFT_852937 [Russula compacta]|nr:hypothetical protein BJV74DRAFT_852937 [Russula compacta]